MRICSFWQRALFAAVFCLNAIVFPQSARTVWAAQLAAPVEQPVIGPRMPALSPDGKKIAFVWRGDIWVADSSGGRAYPVTSSVAYNALPVFSPDGQWIAFSTTRNGSYDIYVVPATGGTARQMTFSQGLEVASDWSPDGKSLIFSTVRDTANTGLFTLDVNTLRFNKLTEGYAGVMAATYSPDGKKIVFQRDGFKFAWTRPRYHGSGATQMWTLDLASGERTDLADDGRQHLWPHFLPDGAHIVAVTVGELTDNAQWLNKPPLKLDDNAQRTPNLWSFPAEGKGAPKQLTFFVGGSVRYPMVARRSGAIAFEHEHDIYVLAPGAAEPKKLTLYCTIDGKGNDVQRETFTSSNVQEAHISPDGKTFGFVLQNDIWTVPIERARNLEATEATRLTDYPGFDRDFTWSKDAKQIFFVSDREHNDRVFAMDVATKTVRPFWTGSDDASSPTVTPDGELAAFWAHGAAETGGLYVKPAAPDRADAAPKRIVSVPGAAQGQFSFSPDSKWVAYTRRGVESGGLNIYIAPADGSGSPVNVTRLNVYNRLPTWSPDGKYIFFGSTRQGPGLYVIPLQPEKARASELEMKFTHPTDPVKVAIDFTDISDRIRKLSILLPETALTIDDEGMIRFASNGDIYQLSYDGKEVHRLTNGVVATPILALPRNEPDPGGSMTQDSFGETPVAQRLRPVLPVTVPDGAPAPTIPAGPVTGMEVSPDGRTIYLTRAGGLFTLRTTILTAPVVPVPFTALWEHDMRAERHAAFTQLWRSYNRSFYDGNFHGRDWSAIRARYEPMLAGVGTREEFATLLNMMIGEIEASHSEVGPAPAPQTTPTPEVIPGQGNLGVYYDYSYVGPGIRVRDVPRHAPGTYPQTRIKPGEYIVAVGGHDVTLDENLYKWLNYQAYHDLTLLVNDKPTREGARTVVYRALDASDWFTLHYDNRADRARRATDTLSKGTVAYVDIASMGNTNETTFDRELYEYADGKKAVVIDVRFNGGGNIADDLIGWLAIKPYGSFVPRNGYPQPEPFRGWRKPIVVLMNDQSLSNAEMFAYDMRATGLAKLVGTPTPGYVIWTTRNPLVDGTNARLPGEGIYRLDGSPMEDMGEQPDVRVDMTDEDWVNDRDPQLEKAVETLMR